MCNDLTRQIMLHKDDAYKALTLKLTPGLKPDSVIGVRIPILRKIAKDARQEEARAFIDVLPHDYYEENNLHGFLIERIKDTTSASAVWTHFFLTWIIGQRAICVRPKRLKAVRKRPR